jgi:hypothetical protein
VPTQNQAYNFSNVGTDAAFNSLGNWSVNPPTFNSANSTIYYAAYTAIETVTNGVAQGTGTVSFGTKGTGTNFTGLVTFISDGSGGYYWSDDGSTQFTQINGGGITTGTIQSNGMSSTVGDGSDFTSNGTYINLDNGAIASENFRIDNNGNAEFSGTVEASSFTGTNTVGSTDGKIRVNGTGGAYIEINGNTEQMTVFDGSNTRVILGKLS